MKLLKAKTPRDIPNRYEESNWDMKAKQFIKRLKTYQSDEELGKIQRYFKSDGDDNQIIGVRMKNIFDLAKNNSGMPLDEVEKLLENPYYEARMGAVSILDFKARPKSITEENHKKLFDLYLNRHDRINNWDFVDRAAKHVVGKYLHEFNMSRNILYVLAKSENVWERRTAIVSTSYFLKKGNLEDTFKVAEILVNDDHEMIHKAVGSWIRHAGQQDRHKLLTFLDKHAAYMPRMMLNKAIGKLNEEQKEHYRSLNKTN